MAEPAATVRRLNIAAAVVLAAGLAIAAAVFLQAGADDDDGDDVVGYVIVGGKSVPIRRGDSVQEQQQLERIGGRAAVVGVEIDHFLGSLWHGRRLAYTLAGLSVSAAFACWRIGRMIDVREGL